MKYTEFVKENYDKVAHLPTTQRMAQLGKMWRESGHANKKVHLKGKKLVVGEEGGMFIKRKGGKRGKKAVGEARGKGIISGLLDSVGLGVKPSKKGGSMERIAGKGIISDALGAFGLGVHKKGRGRPTKGKGVAGGTVVGGSDEKGSGLFSGLLNSIGLGMPNKVKQKHYNRMVALEKQLHSKGKLTPVQHNKLKVYHTLHGAGFFDSLWSGIKKGASAVASVVPHAISAIPQVLKVIPEAAKFVPAVGKLAGPLAKVAPLAALL
jgi:hypothetical protein